jgi:N,N'-diacetyllegionaminate synthase
MNIKNIKIGKNYKTFLIAEVGLSHEGSIGIAFSMIDSAKEAGADAVKFQMHIAEEESTNFEKFRSKIFIQDKTRFAYWKRTSFTLDEWFKIKRYCKKKKIIFLCSPFSLKAVEYLKKLDVDAWKIASGEFNNLLLLNKITKISNKPLILSTGLTYENEIVKVLKFLRKKNKNIILLQCTSEYPTKIENVGHNLINEFKKKYKIEIGISDHSGNINSLISAITMGAKVIETHVCYHKNYFGADTSSSITFEDLKFLSKFSIDYFKIQNSKNLKSKLNKNQRKLRKLFNKCLAFNKEIKKNTKIKVNDLMDIKPMVGIQASNFEKIIGKTTNSDVKRKQVIKLKNLK